MKNILEIKQLSKAYGSIKAVDQISFNVAEGELFAFLGPNGAGKSTTINMLCTLLQKDEGDIHINGFILDKDNDSIRKNIGVVFQNSFLDDGLSVYENLATRAVFYGLSATALKERIKILEKELSLSDFMHRPYGKLSGGQRRRVDIARALVHTPKILFLDEPTTGLDPQTRQSIWAYIDKLRKENLITIFLTTHYMEEADRCDQVCIIDHGKILVHATPSELKIKYAPTLLKLRSSTLSLMDLEKYHHPVHTKQGFYLMVVPNSLSALPILDELKNSLESFEVVEGSMDEVFLALTGTIIREEA